MRPWLSLLLPPIAIAIAILRYRLYDIDRIVSNTVGYAIMTVVLFVVFAVVNIGLQGLMRPGGDDDLLAVALATLLVAALITPVRGRVQRVVDRRFHRARYDWEQMVSAFASRLRDELDLGTVADELTATIRHAVQPSSAAVWLRGGAE